jgi:L-seryl-tRNA(Ser) seleniumtransferase
VPARALSALAKKHGVPLVNDLGSGTLVDLKGFDLTHEPTVSEAVADGADLVTFSGDKLLGGPQAGFIVGRADLLVRISRNPMKRALRLDKVRLAALEATLKLYRDPDRLAARLPTLRLLARPKREIQAAARRVVAALRERVGDDFAVDVVACESQIGSGALPLQTVPSAGISIRPLGARRRGHALEAVAESLRARPIPVIGRIADDALVLDLRCLEDEAEFLTNLAGLRSARRGDGAS